MLNSTMLYQHPGPYEMHGDKFNYVVVDDKDVEEVIKKGWYRTTSEALEKSTQKVDVNNKKEPQKGKK